MNQNEKVEVVRTFLNRDNLKGTDLKLKQSCLQLDQSLAKGRAELDQLQSQLEQLKQSVNDKNMEVLNASQQLEGLCGLILEVVGPN